jgi:ligand-binding sensor domain-containing protein
MKRRWRRAATAVVGVSFVLGVAAAIWVFYVIPKQVDRAIAEARRSGSAREIRVTRGPARRFSDARKQGVTALTSTREWIDGASAFGRIYAATSGGVVVLRPDGVHEQTLTWGDGLGAAAGTAIVNHGTLLALGGADGSVTLLDETRGEVVRFDTGKAGASVTDLASDGDLLYVGTFGAGLIVWDGRKAAALEVAGGETLVEITALAHGRGGLAVGTSTGAVLVRRDGKLVPADLGAHASRDRVTALAWDGDSLLVGTPFGLSRLRADGSVQRERQELFVTSLLTDPATRRIYIGTFDAGVIVTGGGVEQGLGGGQRIARVRFVGDRPMAFGPGGAWDLSSGGFVAVGRGLPPSLSGAHVTALAGRPGEIWVGTFDDGIDVLDPDGRPLRHLPAAGSPYGADQVNAIEAIAGDDMMISTVRGVVVTGARGERRVGTKDGLIGEQVQDTAARGSMVAFATNRGLTLVGADGMARSIYAMQGLANNHTYAVTWGADGKLYVGTLGGVSIVTADLRVERSIGAGNGRLRAAWVTALAATPEGVYVGTYGGGVVRLGPDGQVDDVGGEIARARVNPGALLVDGERVYAGTLEHGLLVYDRPGRRWRQVTEPLGSRSVTALLRSGDALWVGTDQGLVKLDVGVIDAALSPVPQS